MPCRHVLVEFLPWREGNEKHDKLCSDALELLQTDTGGDDFTGTGDGDKDTFKVETGLGFSTISTSPNFYLPSGV